MSKTQTQTAPSPASRYHYRGAVKASNPYEAKVGRIPDDVIKARIASAREAAMQQRRNREEARRRAPLTHTPFASLQFS